MTGRDRSILFHLNAHGFLTTSQLTRFCFTSHATDVTAGRTTRRVLARLERDQLIRPLRRRQGGPLAGSTPATWFLSPVGRRLLDPALIGRRSATPSLRWLRHRLAVADTHLAVLDHAHHHGLTAHIDLEPDNWRPYLGGGGEPRTLKPDLTAVVGGTDSGGDFHDVWAIEVDCGTESIPTLKKKCQQYIDYYATGSYENTSPARAATDSDERPDVGVMPFVLWVFVQDEPANDAATTSPSHPASTHLPPRPQRRLNQLQAAIQRQTNWPPELFHLTLDTNISTTIASATGGQS